MRNKRIEREGYLVKEGCTVYKNHCRSLFFITAVRQHSIRNIAFSKEELGIFEDITKKNQSVLSKLAEKEGVKLNVPEYSDYVMSAYSGDTGRYAYVIMYPSLLSKTEAMQLLKEEKPEYKEFSAIPI